MDDAEIERLDDPLYDLIELSLMRQSNPKDILSKVTALSVSVR